jgi:hypothetical protein
MYSGFGMRKEVYTRKPKKLFDKTRQLYKDEALNHFSDHSKENADELKARVRKKLKRNLRLEAWTRIFSIALTLIVLVLMSVGVRYIIDFTSHKTQKYANKAGLFRTIVYTENGVRIKYDYFIEGPKASTTALKGELKHQNSESYYETGEQFRSALFYYDTLIRETYFYKNGDTIKNFPRIEDMDAHHISIPATEKHHRIELDYYDGKIISGTYTEKAR